MTVLVESTSAVEVAEYRRRKKVIAKRSRRLVPVRDPSPVLLGARLDPMIVLTPALEVLDQEMNDVAESLRVMFKRRRLFARLAAAGMPVADATRDAAAGTPSAGNNRLLVSMPPQEGKTTAISRYGVLWLLRQFPGLRVVIVSFDGVNASRISYQARGDIELFDGTADNPDLGLRLAKDQKAASRWRLAAPDGGEVYAIGIGGGLTGRPVDVLLIDDPVKDDKAASSELQSSHAWVWWQSVGRPRLAPGAPVIVVGTRWHESDLIGRLIEKERDDEAAGVEHYDRWRVVNIPAQADHDPERGEVDVLGREPGEYMVSARGRTQEEWEAAKNGTAIRLWTALYQGSPSPEEGNIWLKSWWRRYETALWSAQGDGTFRLPGEYSLLTSWDMAFKDTASSDYVVGQVWAKRGAECFLIYSVWDRLDFTKTLDAVERVARIFPQATKHLIEAKANGDAVLSSLKKKVPGMIPANPTDSKAARAEAVSPFLRAGNVHLPTIDVAVLDPALAWDPDGLINEAKSFPFGAHDDQVDAASQALAEMYLGPSAEVAILRPKGRIPTRVNGPGLGPVQRRINERIGRA